MWNTLEAVRSMERLGRIARQGLIELIPNVDCDARGQVVCRLKQRTDFDLRKRPYSVFERRETNFMPLFPSTGPIFVQYRLNERLMFALVGEGRDMFVVWIDG